MNTYEELKALFYNAKDSKNSFHLCSEVDVYDCRDDDTLYDDDADCVCD